MNQTVKPNPVLAASIFQLQSLEGVTRIALPPKAVEAIKGYVGALCRVLTPRMLQAYVLEPYAASSLYAWVARTVHPDELWLQGLRVYEVRRREANPNEEPQVITLEDLRRMESPEPSVGGYLDRLYSKEYRLHEPEPVEPERSPFDFLSLIDLPPDGYPLSGTTVEGIRNMITKRDPGSWERRWAFHEWCLLKQEITEERHAQRVLDNEFERDFERT